MSILEDLPLNELELGKLLRIPCEFIDKGSKEKFNKTLLKNLSEQLKISQKNILPIFIKQIAEDEYEAVHNTLVLAAAKKAKIDFVFCIAVNDEMETQLLSETGDMLRISLLDSAEKEIVEVLNFAIEKEPKLKRLQVEKVAKTIIEARTPSWSSLKTLSKLRCGVGAKTVPLLSKYFIFSD